ncbi:MAG: DUF4159 domain-containing protein [Planctomycetaceae bacterium]
MYTLRMKAIICLLLTVVLNSPMAFGQPDENLLSDAKLRDRVQAAMKAGTDWLIREQQDNGSWKSTTGIYSEYTVGVTSLAVLALINCDVPLESPAVRRGLEFLRNLPTSEPKSDRSLYEASVMIMALSAAEQPEIDRGDLSRLANLIAKSQCTEGQNSGLWGYQLSDRGGRPGQNGEDRSNGQFAILGLREAAYAGIRIDREVWQRSHDHWVRGQESKGRSSGAWSYRVNQTEPSGSMTSAGLSTLAITSRMLHDDSDVDQDGRPDCCAAHPPLEAFEKGRQWLADSFTVYSNPGSGHQHLYYLYGLERAARLGNVRYFGDHDWYREGARYLQEAQRGDGGWHEGDTAPEVSTAFALLFLSKGLSRVVVNKLDYVSTDRSNTAIGGDWNRHPLDVPNLIEKIDGLKGWPPRLTSQVLTLSRLKDQNAVTSLNQAPVLFLSGTQELPFTDEHIRWLRDYVDEGGFILAMANCSSDQFNDSFRRVIEKMFPHGEAGLQRLTSDHPVFRSEYLLPGADSIELYGVDFGCRTAIMFSPEDHACLWQKWMKHDPQERSEALIQRILRATRIGTNILAYATGREPPAKLDASEEKQKKNQTKIERGLLEIAQLRYRGNWDIAPRAVRNLLDGLNETAGITAAAERKTVPISLDQLKRYPLVYLHGRYRFQLTDAERDSLRDHLNRGGFLFADACCGSERFDQGFRELMSQLFPEHSLQPIPADHELFTAKIGHDIATVRLRKLVPSAQNAAIQTRTESVPPQLEGIELNGRLAVVYSRYDISCALENQASLSCDGYEEADAMKLAVNIVRYAILQDPAAPEK